ncbi:MAG: ABC transporter permease, partial [Spirosomaceae bacterium]|nr:ABC transporter permease [Spirosomataceae bacterium]
MKLSNIAPLGGLGAKIALRNLTKNKVYSIINIAGLATGMAVAMLIGLWVWDELSFNKNFTNYERIGRLLQNRTFDGKIGTYNAMPIPMSAELKSKFPDFEMVALGSQEEHKFGFKENVLTKSTYFVEADFTKIFDLKMEKGVREGVQNPNTVMISSATAQALFGQEAPIGKTLRMDNKVDFQVTGVFQDFPKNSEFFGIHVIAPFSNYISLYQLKNNLTQWGSNSFACFILLNQNASFEQAQAKIFKVFDPHIDQDEKLSNPEVLISRMQDWHLRANYEDGVQQGGAIEIVWLFGIIGVFVLILACINFMNLSTARSEKRAKEVGVRKAIGSLKGQLIYQFLSESILITFIAFLFAVTLVGLSLSVFNGIADKAIEIPFQNPIFWVACSVVIVVTGILAGSYPALYLSSFNPVKTLKGTFRVGRFASLPR